MTATARLNVTSPKPSAGERQEGDRVAKKGRSRVLIVVFGGILTAVAGAYWIRLPAKSETTDNAYVGADSSVVAPRVRGFVQAIIVRDNQSVVRGQPLVRIDAEEFDTKVEVARADLATAIAERDSAAASLTHLADEERLADAGIEEARAAIAAAGAQAARTEADDRRYARLIETGAVSHQSAETAHAAAVSGASDLARVQATLEVARRRAEVTRGRRGDLVAVLARAEAAIQQRRSALELAQQDERHAVISSPVDGVVADRQVNVGDYVQPGTRVMTVVPLGAVYVTANFKETQTERMLPGQRATVYVDALPGKRLTGYVDSIAPGSGSTFALLPYEPGTGNFTKIVQRVPVRIKFDPEQSSLLRLRPGLSASVQVDLVDASHP